MGTNGGDHRETTVSTPPTLPTQPDAEHLGPWRRWFEPLEAYVVMLWVLLACALTPAWVQSDGSDVARQMLNPWTVVAVGLALVLREGGVDLSVWAVFTLAAVVAARLAEAAANPLWILTVVICVGVAFGLVHAALTLLKAPSWVVTPITATGAMVLTGYLACGQVLDVDKDQLARWPGAVLGAQRRADTHARVRLRRPPRRGRGRAGRRRGAAPARAKRHRLHHGPVLHGDRHRLVAVVLAHAHLAR